MSTNPNNNPDDPDTTKRTIISVKSKEEIEELGSVDPIEFCKKASVLRPTKSTVVVDGRRQRNNKGSSS
ncbi:hypothetical protein M0802_012340 [Mischocyttarus mexicanus]|nr:hypothetical protein M0802_012340 [Mischocyttarus mexicanus]